MDYRPMFDAIRAGVAIPEEYAFNMIIGRDNEKKLIENDVDYISQTNMSKIRIFMGDYGYGKTTLAKYAISIASQKAFLYSLLTEKDYKGIYKQDEFFKTIMRNLKFAGFEDNPLEFIMNTWAEKMEKKHGENIKDFNIEQIGKHLKNEEKISGGFLIDICAAYLYNFINKKNNNHLLAYLYGDKIEKRELRQYGITHFLEDDGWNFLDNFMSLMRSLGVIQGLLLVMDELENLRQCRSDIRGKTYNHLRDIFDKLPGGEIRGIYSIWLGTMDWLEDASKGIKSYSALYDRIKSETQVQTSESIVIEMGYLEQKDVKEVVEKFVSLYEESYSTNIGSEKLKQIQKHAVSKFSDSQGDISIAPRRIIKWLVEVLDKLKDSPGSINDVLEQVPVALATGEDSGANYDDLFDGEEEDE
jgi:hypothetical protein